jgi:hypothetical protein
VPTNDEAVLIAVCDGTPLLQPGPESLDNIAVAVDPVRTSDRRLTPLRRDGRSGSHVPEVFGTHGRCSRDPPQPRLARPAESAAVLGLTRYDPTRDAGPHTVGDHASPGAIGMYGDLQGIAGRALQEIEGLQHPLLEGGTGE